ncbi:hypothetical protein [Rhodospirillaceae bacterium SYSU D60014]|uniref:hypothetical protein n=1 Tax=Virgifigura deserti TaxID=2268457 RepID=UPI0013C46F8F
MPAETPRNFFDASLKPAVEEWRRDRLSRQKALQALAQADVMAERMFRHLQRHDPARLAGIASATAYRNEVRARHLTLGLAWDAHDRGAVGVGRYGSGEQMTLVEDDGTRHPLALVLDQVLTAWEMELSKTGL